MMKKHCGSFVKCNNAEGCFGCEYEGEEDTEEQKRQEINFEIHRTDKH